jgi:hypothetical protein
MTRVDRIVRPVTRDELDSIGELWVERALALTGRGLAWMQRLHERQLGVFARGASKPMPEASALPCAA